MQRKGNSISIFYENCDLIHSLVLVDTYRTYGDELVTMIHHGNQQVEQHDDVDQGEAPEHDEAPEPGELLDPGQLEVVQVYQAERRPEQGL